MRLIKAKKVIKDNKGQGIMEYLILSSLIGIFALMTVKEFGQVINKRISNMKEKVVKEIK
ncbi:hypothetical protein OAT67_04025 [Bacteriovoracaceae bacterium]|nr:hypothetical protein [Bacteriovoracaceae bacterium]